MIDRDRLAAQTFDDADLARQVLDLFVQQCAVLLPLIRDGTLPLPLRADHAHTLRGSALGVGAGAVVQDCAALETAFRRGEPNESAVDRLAVSVEATIRAIADWRP